HLLDVLEGERRDPIEQVEKLVAVLERDDVGLGGQHLAELDEAAAQVLEEPPKPLGTRERGARDARDEPRPGPEVRGDEVRGRVRQQQAGEVHQAAKVPHGCADDLKIDPLKIDVRRSSMSSMTACICCRTSTLMRRTAAGSSAVSGGYIAST